MFSTRIFLLFCATMFFCVCLCVLFFRPFPFRKFLSSHCFRFFAIFSVHCLYSVRVVHIHLFKHKMIETYNLRNRTVVWFFFSFSLYVLSFEFGFCTVDGEDRKRHKHALIYFRSTLFANNCKQDLCSVTHFTFCLCPSRLFGYVLVSLKRMKKRSEEIG